MMPPQRGQEAAQRASKQACGRSDVLGRIESRHRCQRPLALAADKRRDVEARAKGRGEACVRACVWAPGVSAARAELLP